MKIICDQCNDAWSKVLLRNREHPGGAVIGVDREMLLDLQTGDEPFDAYGERDMDRLRLRVLVEMCEQFDERPDTFPQIVSWALEVMDDGRRRIASRFDLCAATVERWALINSLPCDDVQELVVDGIREMAVERMEGLTDDS